MSAHPSGSPGRTAETDRGFDDDPDSDVDGDGLPALLEYAIGTSDADPTPGSRTGSISFFSGDNSALLFSVQVNSFASDVRYSVESTHNLIDWTSAGAELHSDIPNVDGITRVVTYRLPVAGNLNRYLRLKVALKP